jgi:hypothetical protein
MFFKRQPPKTVQIGKGTVLLLNEDTKRMLAQHKAHSRWWRRLWRWWRGR